MNRNFGGRYSPFPQHQAIQRIALALIGICALSMFTGIVLFNHSAESSSLPPQVQTRAPEPEVEVWVAARSIPPESPLEPELFRREMRPRSSVPAGTIVSFEEVRGRYARYLIAANQILHRDHTADTSVSAPLSAKLPNGFRAVAVRVDKIATVEGWLRPGDRVDVLMISVRQGDCKLVPIVQNVKVISVNGSLESPAGQRADSTQSGTVSLALQSADANRIHLAAAIGSITFNLRGDDVGPGDMSAISCRDVQEPGHVKKDEGCTNRITIGGHTYCVSEKGTISDTAKEGSI